MSSTTKLPRLMVINEPDGRRFSKALALEIGRDHAEVLLQIEYLISISRTPMQDGKPWTKQSVASLQEEHFPYWGRTFIGDILTDLCDGYDHIRYTITGFGRSRKRSSEKVHIDPLLTKGRFNELGWDATTWYTLNLEGIGKLKAVKIDEQAVAVTAKRERVPGLRRTRHRSADNPLPVHDQPVPESVGTFNHRDSTETPPRGGESAQPTCAPEPPPNFSPEELSQFRAAQELEVILPIVTTRTLAAPKTKREKLVEFLEK